MSISYRKPARTQIVDSTKKVLMVGRISPAQGNMKWRENEFIDSEGNLAWDMDPIMVVEDN